SVARDAGINTIMVPYPAGPVFTQAIVGGTVHLGINSEGTALGLADRVRILAVTGRNRSSSLPNVPTLAELGFPNIQGLALSLNTRSGTPKEATDKLYAAAKAALDRQEVKSFFAKARFEVMADPSPQTAAKRLNDEATFFADIAAKTGFKPD